MATTLSTTTKGIRVLAKYFFFFCLGIIVLYTVFNFFFFLKSTFFPSQPANFETFGLLPKLKFPSPEFQINYTINTISGIIPTFPSTLNVYKIKKQDPPNLLTLSKTREKMKNIGFTQNETKITDTLYQWSNIFSGVEKTIQYNTFNNNFEILSNYLNNNDVLNSVNLPKDNQAFILSLDFLRSVGQDLTDIDEYLFEKSYFIINQGNLLKIDSSNGANVIKINLIQKRINNLDIYYPYFEGSTMQFFLVGSKSSSDIARSHFNHQIIDGNIFSLYPIKSGKNAFDDLKNGKAYIFNPENQRNVEITDVSLGYYLGEEQQDYLIPIAVFKGRGFKAYVQLIP